MRSIEFKGVNVEYDENVLKSYKNMKKLARIDTNPAGAFDIFEALYLGRDEEYADAFADDDQAMGELFKAVVADAKADNDIKN